MSKIVWENSITMGDNPASVEMDTGTILLNKDVFPNYSKFTQKFILEHEKGHYNIPTDSEEEADAYALNKLYKTTGKSLKKTIKAITDFLDDENPRVAELYKKALIIDYKQNGNKRAEAEYKNLTGGQEMKQKITGMYSPFVTINNAKGRKRRKAEGGEDIIIDENGVPIVEENIVNIPKRKRYNIIGFEMSMFEILFLVFILVFIVKK